MSTTSKRLVTPYYFLLCVLDILFFI